MSKKFTSAQQHYAVHKLETLAILKALIKWEDKLLARNIHIITDHKALEFFKTQSQLSNRQFCWIDYMSRFNFDITYVKGEYNKVADCLSHYYESDTAADIHAYHDYVQAGLKVDPIGEDLPLARYQEVVERTVEMCAMHAMETQRSQQLQEAKGHLEIEAQELLETRANAPLRNQDSISLPANEDQGPGDTSEPQGDPAPNLPATLGDALGNGPTRGLPDLPKALNTDDILLQSIKDGYPDDPMFRLVLAKPEQHTKSFTIREGLIWTTNLKGSQVLCLPRDQALLTRVLTQAHKIIGHFGGQRMCEYI